MHSIKVKWISLALAAASAVFLSGCCELAYRQAIACQVEGACRTPASPPVALPPEPTAVLASDRGVIPLGESVTLTWHTEHATKVTIEPIGLVQPDGSLKVTPSGSTKYHLVAEGSGGVNVSTIWVTVRLPPAPASPETDRTLVLTFQTILFDYGQYTIRPDQEQALEYNRQLLLEHSDVRIVIAGYCDTGEADQFYLTLGKERADAVMQALGVNLEKIKTVGFSNEEPVCLEQTEDCAQRNRRVEFVQEKDKSSPSS